MPGRGCFRPVAISIRDEIRIAALQIWWLVGRCRYSSGWICHKLWCGFLWIASAKSAMDKLLSDNFSLISFPICTSFFILYSFKINRISGSPQMDYLKKRPYGKGHKKRGELHCATNIKASPKRPTESKHTPLHAWIIGMWQDATSLQKQKRERRIVFILSVKKKLAIFFWYFRIKSIKRFLFF